jgi:hypothetical protein
MTTCSPAYRICMMVEARPDARARARLIRRGRKSALDGAMMICDAGLSRLEVPSLCGNLVVPENGSGAR